MGKRARKNYRNLSVEDGDDFDDLFEDEFDSSDLTREIHSTNLDESDSESGVSARRKIERRRDMKKLYSQLDEWEEFGKNPERYI